MKKKVVNLDRTKFEVGDTFNPYGLFIGSFIPQWLEIRPELSPGAKLVYARMCRHSGEKGVCRPNQNLLGAEVGLKKRQTQTYIQELEVNNLIRPIRRGQGRSNEYEFLIHEWMFAAMIDTQDTAYQSVNDMRDAAHPEVQDAAHPEVQDAAYPYPYKKRIIEKNHRKESTAPKNGADDRSNATQLNLDEIEISVQVIFSKLDFIASADSLREDITKIWNLLENLNDPETMLEFWNKLGLTNHTFPPRDGNVKYLDAIQSRLSDNCSWREMAMAMVNYSIIRHSKKHSYPYLHHITAFINRHIDNFPKLSEAWSNFDKSRFVKKTNNSNGKSGHHNDHDDYKQRTSVTPPQSLAEIFKMSESIGASV